MADLVHYDYESMDNAYEDMKKTSDTMRQSCEDLTSDALRLLQGSAGAYADGYEAKVKKLNDHFEELNDPDDESREETAEGVRGHGPDGHQTRRRFLTRPAPGGPAPTGAAGVDPADAYA